MSDSVVEALLLDLLDWVSSGEKTYAQVMEAWRTSCPRMPVWEEATDRGLVAREYAHGVEFIRLTPSGMALLQHRRYLID